jgi:nitroreductase
MENLNIQKNIDKINSYHEKFLDLQNFNYNDKIAIDDNDILYIQNKTPWRYIVRKFKKQNRDRLSKYLSTNINDYINNINFLIKIYEFSKEKDIKQILENIIIFISSILGVIVSLRNYYNLKNNSNNISMILESTNNKLNSVMIKIKLII